MQLGREYLKILQEIRLLCVTSDIGPLDLYIAHIKIKILKQQQQQYPLVLRHATLHMSYYHTVTITSQTHRYSTGQWNSWL